MFGDERGELAEVVRRHNDGDLPGDGPIYLDNLDRVWMARKTSSRLCTSLAVIMHS